MGTWERIWQTGGVDLWSIPDRRVTALIARWKQAGNIRRVLDLGCGAGRHLLPLAAEGFDAVGIDHSPAGIEACRERLRQCGLTAGLHCTGMDCLPFPDGHFDAIIAYNSIYHGSVAQLRQAVAALHAKLRPGAAGFFTLPSRENRMYGKGEAIEPHTYVNPGMFAGLFPNDGERGIVHYFASEEDIRSLFSGFEIASLQQEELHLASAKNRTLPVSWLRVPHACFWNMEVVKK